MELAFNGHACLTLTSVDGRVVVTDPYRPGALGGRIAFGEVTERADIVTVSHWHVDHSHVTPALGEPLVADVSGAVGGVDFTVVPTYHDRVGGARMGMTSMIAFELDGLRVAHLGDIGCDLTPADVAALGPVDVLIWPVGGTYTLGPEDAPDVLSALRPRLAIPVHFEHARCSLGMQPVDALFGQLPSPPRRPGGSSWSSADGLPPAGKTEVLVLEPRL